MKKELSSQELEQEVGELALSPGKTGRGENVTITRRLLINADAGAKRAGKLPSTTSIQTFFQERKP